METRDFLSLEHVLLICWEVCTHPPLQTCHQFFFSRWCSKKGRLGFKTLGQALARSQSEHLSSCNFSGNRSFCAARLFKEF